MSIALKDMLRTDGKVTICDGAGGYLSIKVEKYVLAMKSLGNANNTIVHMHNENFDKIGGRPLVRARHDVRIPHYK